jgi:hypothetical protein
MPLQVKQFKQDVAKHAARVEADVQRLLTHILKANVPGSGIEPEVIQLLSRLILFGLPGMFLLSALLRCMCRSRKRSARPTDSASSGSVKTAATKVAKRRHR